MQPDCEGVRLEQVSCAQLNGASSEVRQSSEPTEAHVRLLTCEFVSVSLIISALVTDGVTGPYDSEVTCAPRRRVKASNGESLPRVDRAPNTSAAARLCFRSRRRGCECRRSSLLRPRRRLSAPKSRQMSARRWSPPRRHRTITHVG